tara:strand:+ start:224 stop:1030 length:807 start_codon:yes stop_codon:yes gene_type:complete
MNNNLKIYCVTDKPLHRLENSTLNLAGVGKSNFSDKYIKSDDKININLKEKYYSELTFHYWYWKNLLQTETSQWIGFCQKRRFWVNENSRNYKLSKENLKESLLTQIKDELSNFESFLCEPIFVNNVKKIKMLKKGYMSLLKKPSIFFNKNYQSLKFHFDMHHGYGNLDKAISCMNDNDKEDFNRYVSLNIKFNPHIMFISKPEIAERWFTDLFSWLFRCEKIFGFKNLQGYETTRLYAYLAERYLSFWFKKYTKHKNLPWILCDLSD